MMRRSVICSSSESVRPHEPETQETLPSHGREELANGSAGRMTGARSGSARGRFQVIRDQRSHDGYERRLDRDKDV